MRALAKFIVQKKWLFFAIFAAFIIYAVICIPKVNVEYDITTYLPKDTDTSRALEIMNDEFVTYGTATVLVKDVSYDEASELVNKITAEKGVKSLPFSNSDKYYKDRAAKLSITFDGTSADEKAVSAYNSVIDLLDAGGYSYSVPSPLSNNYADTLAHEMLIIIAVAAAVILLVLLFTSKSFAEIIAFPIVFVVAAVLNMGTNYWLGTISFVSNTVCIILQLALAIDYAIILCHRFTEEKERRPGNAEAALIDALAKAIPEISSSSLTTISGLVALMFMQLRLGYDLGMVLAKSIVFSLITVFFLMPGLLMLLTKLMDKSRHRNFVPKLRFWGSGVIKARYALIPVFVALFAAGAVLSQRVDYVYSTTDIDTSRPTETVVAQRECEDIFGYDNVFAVLVPKGDYQKERQVLELVGGEPLIDSAIGLAGIEYNGVYLTDDIGISEFSSLAGVDMLSSMILLSMYARFSGDVFTLNYTAPLIDVLDYLIANADTLPLGDDARATVAALAPVLEDAEAQLAGSEHSRLVFNIAAPTEGDETFELIERITPEVKAIYPDAIFAGESMSSYDLNSSFSSDNILITILTVAFIYLILAITFRSPCIPIVLVLVIQGAIFMNFSIPVIAGSNMYFFTYLIVSSIQMGATIDYAILVTNRFMRLAERKSKRDAMIEAVSGAFPTVFTSGTIMSVAGFLIGFMTSDPLIASIGMSLGEGTLISIICVMTFLPALLYVLWDALKKTVIKIKQPIRKVHLPNPSERPEL